jgi:DNA-binding NarL/FixJ family response regulator
MARILIVDDSCVERKILGRIALALGHTVVGEAANGVQAFEAYSRLNPDVVTMDLTMGGSDGAEAIVKIIAAFPEARIIVVSARQASQVILDALERGARHFLIKPVLQEKVEAVVSSVLQQTFDNKRQLELVRKMKDAGKSIVGCCNSSASDVQHLIARVLIVDDSAVARKILREIMTTLGHVVVGEVTNGSQAFVEYTKLKPDVVTMDLTMQGLGGAEATSKIIAAFPKARIIVISAMEDRRVVIDALERGARHFIIKPISQGKVATVLSNVLQQKFDPQKHLERIRKMIRSEAMSSSVENSGNKYMPPYVIAVQAGGLVHVVMNESLTLTSFQSLLLEIEEHLTATPRVLLDFGAISRLDQELLVKMNRLVMNIVNKSGMVKSISNNKRFVDWVAQMKIENNVNLLTDTLRYFEN